MNVLKVLDSSQRDTDYTSSVSTFWIGRQFAKFPLTNVFEWVSFYEKISYRWNNKNPSKKRKILVRKITTHTEAKIKTWILLTSCLPYSFIIEKFLYFSFLFPWKFVESTCFLEQCNDIEDSSSRENYFSPSVFWPSLKTKIFVKANSKRKIYENIFEKIVFVFNTGNRKHNCNNII